MRLLLPILAAAAVAATALQAPGLLERFRVDSSTDSLVLEGDPEATRYDRTALLFASDEFVLVGLTREDLFTPAGIAAVSSLHARFAEIPGVESVLSIASVPLLRSFDPPLAPLAAAMRQARMGDPGVDLDLAREELTEHRLFRGNLVSADGQTAGIIVTIRARPESVAATQTRLRLLDQRALARAAREAASGDAVHEAARRLAEAEAALAAFADDWMRAEDARKDERIEVVQAVRAVVAAERARGVDAQASGVPAIVVEMVEAIEADLRVFLLGSLAFLIAFLAAVFRRVRWVVLPLLATGATAVWTVWVMYALGKRATIITSNIPSLLLVIGLAHSIHLIVRYREHLVRYPDDSAAERVRRLVRALVWPCLFTATTTAAGFASLYYAGSRPIIDFGFLMALGVGFAFAFTFLFIPAALLLLPGRDEARLERSARALEGVGRASLRRGGLVVAAALLIVAGSVAGMARLQVESRFIDYFDQRSPIHAGLTFVDQRLGGTSGLEVILSADRAGAFGLNEPENLARSAEVVAWLEARPEVGAVMSYVGILDELRKAFPQADRRIAATMVGQFADPATLTPYVITRKLEVAGVTVEPFSAVRIVARVKETDPGLQRGALLADLNAFLAEAFPQAPAGAPARGEPGDGEAEGEVAAAPPLRAEVTGMFVLYANMLESLVGSQVKTALLALAAVWLMLSLLFRNPFAAALAVVPNLLPITFVLGAMGWAGIPLDMATVMIASVSLGIGVDCAIHYLFRYREEVARDGDVAAALVRSHGSIGTSIFFTSLTSAVGFSVLAFSNFRPNAYFGLFTAFAMLAALFAMLTVLPVLISWARPFRREQRAGRRAVEGAASGSTPQGGPSAAGGAGVVSA